MEPCKNRQSLNNCCFFCKLLGGTDSAGWISIHLTESVSPLENVDYVVKKEFKHESKLPKAQQLVYCNHPTFFLRFWEQNMGVKRQVNNARDGRQILAGGTGIRCSY